MQETPDVGPVLRSLRSDRGWTLDELAQQSGVSRSMVSQIERGTANPTLATLWNITRAIGIEIDDLTSRASGLAQPRLDLVSREQTPEMRHDNGAVRLRILSPVDLADLAEWYELSVEPGATLASSSHANGTVEHLSVLDGELAVEIGDTSDRIVAGSTARYRADTDHTIHNPGNTPARALLVVIIRSIT